MHIAAHRGQPSFAPENSIVGLMSGYIAGADVLEFDLHLTKDNVLVLSHDPTVARLTGLQGEIAEMTLAELRELDFSRTFKPKDSPKFQYYPIDTIRKLAIPTLMDLLEVLPRSMEMLIELKHTATTTSERRRYIVTQTIEQLEFMGVDSRVVIYSKDSEVILLIRQLRPDIRCAAFDYELNANEQLDLMRRLKADGLVTELNNVLNANGEMTPLGLEMRDDFQRGKLRIGAILYPRSRQFTSAQFQRLANEPHVWSLSCDDMLSNRALRQHAVPIVPNEVFKGTAVDRSRFALGYAKANKYCSVTQNDGIRISIAPYDGPLPGKAKDPVQKRIEELELRLTFAEKNWPYYSGGGVGYIKGISGDFSAEVDYTVLKVGQATTLEMAVTNVDPGAHRGNPPTSFRHKDSFYDPHGAPPFVGVEHDEDDGFRINWNLGSDYDNNQYGRPVGDGKSDWDGQTPSGCRLRLERRGAYFSAYYRGTKENNDWVCVGNVRNESMNSVVYLRCVAKRWRQEKEDSPSEFHEILANEYWFGNLVITRYF